MNAADRSFAWLNGCKLRKMLETIKEILNTSVEDIAESVLEKYKGDE